MTICTTVCLTLTIEIFFLGKSLTVITWLPTHTQLNKLPLHWMSIPHQPCQHISHTIPYKSWYFGHFYRFMLQMSLTHQSSSNIVLD